MAITFTRANIIDKDGRLYRLKKPETWAIRCQRNSEHPGKAVFTKSCGLLSDAVQALADHDAECHASDSWLRKAERAASSLTLEQGFKNLENSSAAELLNPRTMDGYRSLYRFLLRYFDKTTVIATITLDVADQFVKFMLKHSNSEGASILKALDLLERMSRVGDRSTLPFVVAKNFKVLRAKVRNNPREVPDVTVEQLQVFLENLRGRAYAFALIKCMTGLRDVEIERLKVQDFHFEDGDAWVEAMVSKKVGGRVEPDWRSLGTLHVPAIRAFLADRAPDEWAFRGSGRKTRPGTRDRAEGRALAGSLGRKFERAALSAGIMSEGTGSGYSGLKWMRHHRATLLASFEDEDGLGFSESRRAEAEIAAARSIGTGLAAFHQNYFRKKHRMNRKRDMGLEWRRELRAKRQEALLIEGTFASDPEKVEEWVFGKRTSLVLQTLMSNAGTAMSGNEIARAVGQDSPEQRRKFQVLLSTLARQGKLIRVGRGRFAPNRDVVKGVAQYAPRPSRRLKPEGISAG